MLFAETKVRHAHANDAIEAARDRGAAAFATGQGIERNPYKSRKGYGPAFTRAWRDGWLKARRAKNACADGHDFVMGAGGDADTDGCARCGVLRY